MPADRRGHLAEPRCECRPRSGTRPICRPIVVSGIDEVASVELDQAGTNFVVSWRGRSGGLFSREISAAGQPIAARVEILPTSQKTGTIVATVNSASWLVTFAEQNTFRPLSPLGEVETLPQGLYGLSLASAGGGALLAWNQELAPIHFATSAPGARLVEGPPLVLSGIPSGLMLSVESEHGTLLTFEEWRNKRVANRLVAVEFGADSAWLAASSPMEINYAILKMRCRCVTTSVPRNGSARSKSRQRR
jgi:hypothetical protein